MKTIDDTKTANLSRRRFIVGSATVAGGGLALGLPLPFGLDVAAGSAEAASVAAEGPEVTAWVVIKPDDRCVIRIARSEMGQGTMTGLAQLVAEELECDWTKVTTEFPTPGESLARKRVWGEMWHRRQPRHPHVAGLRAAGRRSGTNDAAAGGGRRVEGPRRRAHRVERRHHACRLEAHDDATARSPRPRPDFRHPIPRRSSSRTRRTGRSPASR